MEKNFKINPTIEIELVEDFLKNEDAPVPNDLVKSLLNTAKNLNEKIVRMESSINSVIKQLSLQIDTANRNCIDCEILIALKNSKGVCINSYRSNPTVNMVNDMGKVELFIPLNYWRILKKHLGNSTELNNIIGE